MGCAIGMVALIVMAILVIGSLASIGAEGFRLYAIWSSLAAVGAALAAPFVFAMRGRDRKADDEQKTEDERRSRVRQPDLGVARERFGGEIPADVLRVFSEPESLLELEGQYLVVDLEESHFVAYIVPLDGLDMTFQEELDHLGLIPLAGDEFGNAYVVRRTQLPADATFVLFWDHDGDDVHDLGHTVDEFFQLTRYTEA